MTDVIERLSRAVLEGDKEGAEESARGALAEGLDPVEVFRRGIGEPMSIVGEKFARWEYFVDEVLLSARAAKTAIGVLRPKMESLEKIGVVVLGTVQGDIHELGRLLVACALEAAGFEVHDLGMDVAAERFVETARDLKADIVGLSALTTATMPEMRHVVEAFKEAGYRDKVKIMIGGTPVSQTYAEQIGADAYAGDMFDAVKVAKELMKMRRDA